MKAKVEEQLPGGWRWVNLGAVCEQVRTYDPASEPEAEFTYIDIGSIDSATKQIAEPKKLLGKQAPSRARQLVKANDVLVSTTRPNLNAVALVPEALNNEVCSTGFCILRANRKMIEPAYLFGFVQSGPFVQALTDLVKGALYPAVTNKQVFDQLIYLPPLTEQQQIAKKINEQFAALEVARLAAEAQLTTLRELPAVLLRAAFYFSKNEESNFTPPPPPPRIIQLFEQKANWPLKKIGEVCTSVRQNIRPDSIEAQNLPYVGLEHVESESGRISLATEDGQQGNMVQGLAFAFDDSHILYSKLRPYLNKVALPTFSGRCSTELIPLLPSKGMDREYLALYLRRDAIAVEVMRESTGSRMPRADMSKLFQL